VTGIAALVLSGDSPVPRNVTETLLNYFSRSANRGFRGYDPARHGLGLVNYQPELIYGLSVYSHSEFAAKHTAQLREAVLTEAYSIYQEAGRPEGMSEQHWDLARQHCGIPDNVYL
jgi:hypothetical protein